MTNFDLIPTSLAIKALRDNGYKNAAYALAELIDNAIQANASSIQLLCAEERISRGKRHRWTAKQVAVLDNGDGMTADVLRIALQFGNGTRLDDRSGIGRFGMGLPNASISQCKQVGVWSWTNGPENAIYSNIDLDVVLRGEMDEVPEPVSKQIPPLWISAAAQNAAVGNSGTLVVWSDLDRMQWTNGRTITDRSEDTIGRMYRNQIFAESTEIHLVAFDLNDPQVARINRLCLPNDPGYLIAPSSTPSPFNDSPMFEHDGDRWKDTIMISDGVEEHPVTIRYTLACPDARSGHNAGAKPHGKHAKKNVGVSLVRANRELDLDQSQVLRYDARERWWGIEVEFPPELDEVFGVTNDKQSARNFTSIAAAFKDLSDEESLTKTELQSQLEEDGEPSAALVEVAGRIESRLKYLRASLKAMRAGTAPKDKRHDQVAEQIGTAATKERQQDGRAGASDADEALPRDERVNDLADELQDSEGLGEAEALAEAERLIDDGNKYVFRSTDLDGSDFFVSKRRAGELLIRLNTEHPAYDNLLEVLDDPPGQDFSIEELQERLERTRIGLKLLFMAWARLLDEAPSQRDAQLLQDARRSWGAIAATFFDTTE